MSWLTDLIRRRSTLSEVLAKSFGKLQSVTGVKLDDDDADAITRRVDEATNAAERVFRDLIEAKAPGLPAAVATLAVATALQTIDAAVAGAMQAVKDRN